MNVVLVILGIIVVVQLTLVIRMLIAINTTLDVLRIQTDDFRHFPI